MAWAYLILAGLFEIGFAVMLKPAEGFTRVWPSLGVIVLGFVSLYFLAVAAAFRLFFIATLIASIIGLKIAT